MTGDAMTLLYAVNYFLSLLFLVGGFVGIVLVAILFSEHVQRNACRRRHPASVARRARIVADRRAVLNRKGRR